MYTIGRLINRAAALTEKEFSPGEIFIITDSKRKYIKPVIPGRLLSYVHVIYKSGANISQSGYYILFLDVYSICKLREMDTPRI
jgi:hypothetical protein